ncbi:Chromobox protein 1 [Balamuthia mandrillaris]
MFGRESNGTCLVDTTHLSDDSWVRQLQETQRELAEEARRVDNAQKEKTKKRHGKLEEEFKVGDLVLIHSKATSIGESKKLRRSWKGGPYKIIKILVNLNRVKRFILCDDEDRQLADDAYEVEKILDHHYTNRGLEYRLKWKGFSICHNSWEPERNVINAPDLVQAY